MAKTVCISFRTVLLNYTIELIKALEINKPSQYRNLINDFYTDALSMKATEIQQRMYNLNAVIRDFEIIFLNNSYYEILDAIQYFINYLQLNGMQIRYNQLFEKECVGYRFVDGRITDITSEEELNEIDEVTSSKYDVCALHISKAISLLYDRDNPDYENSIKECITAVEAMCQIIVGDSKATLGEALKKLNEKIEIHGALQQGYLKIYGYTSDKDGIRHASGLGQSNSTFEKAKYMLVSCSAFVNYLIGIYGKLQ